MTRPQLPDLDVVVPGALPGTGAEAWPASDFTQAWSRLHLPGLCAALKGAQWSAVHHLPEHSASGTRSHALAHAHGFATDRPWPDAAWHHPQASGVQAWVSPCHWHMARGQTLMLDPRDLALDDEASLGFMNAMKPYVEEDGLQLDWHDALHWRLSGPALKAWHAHDLDQVVGRDVQALLNDAPWPAPLNRLHIEMQMLLYTHALNDQRGQRGLPSVNAFWVHGVGEWPAVAEGASPSPLEVRVFDALEQAWRSGGMDPWVSAWSRLELELVPLVHERLGQGAGVRLHWCSASSWRSARIVPPAARGWSLPWPGPQTKLGRHLLALHTP